MSVVLLAGGVGKRMGVRDAPLPALAVRLLSRGLTSVQRPSILAQTQNFLIRKTVRIVAQVHRLLIHAEASQKDFKQTESWWLRARHLEVLDMQHKGPE